MEFWICSNSLIFFRLLLFLITSGYKAGIGFVVPMNCFKLEVKDILLTDCLLRRGEDTNMDVATEIGYCGLDGDGSR